MKESGLVVRLVTPQPESLCVCYSSRRRPTVRDSGHNLSGGLLKSIDVLCTAEGAASGRTRAVLLFTDGIANHGIRETDALREAVQGAIAEKSTSVFPSALALITTKIC